jgi:hypothetical protein
MSDILKNTTSQVHVFTIAALNYMPKVRALFNSVKKFHPEFTTILVLSDEMNKTHDFSAEPLDEVLPASQLGIPDWKGWSFQHNIVELSTAIKPFAMSHLLSWHECSQVIFLDPDIVLFSKFDDIIETLENSNLVITPHHTSSRSTELSELKTELSSLHCGIYNLGFIGVNNTEVGKMFVEWWAKRVYHFCRVDHANCIFYDQRWIDLVPSTFEGVKTIRSSRYNLAPWNHSTRKMTGNVREGFQVDGEPLGFYHFSSGGWDSHRIAVKNDLHKNDSLIEIVEWYEKETEAGSSDTMAKSVWAYGKFTNGEPIIKAQRDKYRDRADLQAQFPDPFDCSQADCYYRWWKKNSRVGWQAIGLQLLQIVKIREYRKLMTRRFWEVFRAEGLSGVILRLRVRTPAQKKMK